MIEWDKSLEIEVFEIDQQHGELVRRFNAFAAAVRDGFKTEEIYEILLFMRGYCVLHFGSEEEVMSQVGFPGLHKHRLLHQEFVGKHFWLHQCLVLDEPGVAQEIVDYLEEWITHHISTEDKKIGEFICSEVQRLRP